MRLACLLVALHAATSSAQTNVAVKYGDTGRPVLLPCSTLSAAAGSSCQWLMPHANGTQSLLEMSSIQAGGSPGLSHPENSTGNCDLQIDAVDTGHQGMWYCEHNGGASAIYSLVVNYVSPPVMFFNGRSYNNNSIFQICGGTSYMFQCIVDRSRPAVNIRWILNDGTDISEDAITASYPLDSNSEYHSSAVAWLHFSPSTSSVSCSVDHMVLEEPLVTIFQLEVAGCTGTALTSSLLLLLTSLLHLLLCSHK